MPARVIATEENRSRPAAPRSPRNLDRPRSHRRKAVAAAAFLRLHAPAPAERTRRRRPHGPWRVRQTPDAAAAAFEDRCGTGSTVSCAFSNWPKLLRRSGLLDIARPLMHAVSMPTASRSTCPSGLVAAGAGLWAPPSNPTDVTVGRRWAGPPAIMAASGNSSQPNSDQLPQVALSKPHFRVFRPAWRRGKPALLSIAEPCSRVSH